MATPHVRYFNAISMDGSVLRPSTGTRVARVCPATLRRAPDEADAGREVVSASCNHHRATGANGVMCQLPKWVDFKLVATVRQPDAKARDHPAGNPTAPKIHALAHKVNGVASAKCAPHVA